jgi:uncharacterized protein YndB with AHSA1/START domain
MSRIITRATIVRSPEEVFAYVTSPGHWPEWHPSSLGVTGATDHSLAVAEEVTESFLVAGRKGSAHWTVRERVEPRRWVIFGLVEGGGTGTITYALTPLDGGTAFERAFTENQRRKSPRLEAGEDRVAAQRQDWLLSECHLCTSDESMIS